MATKDGGRRSRQRSRHRGPYAGRTPQKSAEEELEEEAVPAFKMPRDTSPTPPGPVKISASSVALSPPAPEKDSQGEVEARLQSLELTVSHLEKNLTDRIQETVGTAMLAALREEREQTPQWASSFRDSLTSLEGSLKFVHESNLEAAEKIRGCEGQLAVLQQQVEACCSNGHPIYLAERAAMCSTAASTRVGGFKEGEDGAKFLHDYVKSKFPSFGKISITKSGPASAGVYVATFQKPEEAKVAAKALRTDHSRLQVRPQLPPVVLESQAPLKRAFGALAELVKTETLPDIPNFNAFKIDFKERTVTNGELWLARQMASGEIQVWTPVLGQDFSNRVLSAVRSWGGNKGQGKEKSELQEKGKVKAKGKGKGKKGQSSNSMDVDSGTGVF